MKLLIAEDEPVALHLLTRLFEKEYELELADDGQKAWSILSRPDGPRLAVLDWQMPGMDGAEICRRVRQELSEPRYLLLVTATRKSTRDVISGFGAGADDYVRKPFNADELRARVAVGRRVLELQQSLADRVAELQNTLDRVHALEGLLPICSWCKRIRNDQNYWEQLESYLTEHSQATFTHGICPECCEKLRSEGKWVVSSAP